ncbi:MAG: UDP-N-acetylglucosamine diphosphorylase [Opitutaceae bacterium]|nr:UDP-N-acetylglucosamine diphosphorylase [Opitutaceae bacterium]
MHASAFFDLPDSLSLFSADFPSDVPPWEWLGAIGPAVARATQGRARRVDLPSGVHVEGDVFIDPTVRLPASATLIGPAWIGPGTEVRAGAFVRGNVIVGRGCVLGNSCEFKNCLLLDGVQVPHFSYVGDSVLGNKAHLGAGVILSNLRLDQKPIAVAIEGVVHSTGLRKFGAIVGDAAEVGCNAVLNPGSVLGKRALIMPTVAFSGYLPANTIARSRDAVVHIPRRD